MALIFPSCCLTRASYLSNSPFPTGSFKTSFFLLQSKFNCTGIHLRHAKNLIWMTMDCDFSTKYAAKGTQSFDWYFIVKELQIKSNLNSCLESPVLKTWILLRAWALELTKDEVKYQQAHWEFPLEHIMEPPFQGKAPFTYPNVLATK